MAHFGKQAQRSKPVAKSAMRSVSSGEQTGSKPLEIFLKSFLGRFWGCWFGWQMAAWGSVGTGHALSTTTSDLANIAAVIFRPSV